MSGAIIGVHDKVNFPKQCYNAQNHWQLGWYSQDTMKTVEPGSTVTTVVKVVAFADHELATSTLDQILVQAGGDLYMQYNRAKGFNADTYEYQDKLVIVSWTQAGTWIQATLDETDSVYTRQQDNLRVEVCDQVYAANANRPDYLVVAIGYGTNSICIENNVGLVFAPQQVEQVNVEGCFDPGIACESADQCCSDKCHNGNCSGIYPTSKDDYIIGDFRVRGGGRGLRHINRGLRGSPLSSSSSSTTIITIDTTTK
jgi:hypothetical protein